MLIDNEGKNVNGYVYTDIGDIIDGKARAKRNNRWGNILPNGQELLQCVEIIDSETMLTKSFGLWGVSVRNEQVIPNNYWAICTCNGHFLGLSRNCIKEFCSLTCVKEIPVYRIVCKWKYSDGGIECDVYGNRGVIDKCQFVENSITEEDFIKYNNDYKAYVKQIFVDKKGFQKLRLVVCKV